VTLDDVRLVGVEGGVVSVTTVVLKVAVIVVLEEIVVTQLPVPEQPPPDQPEKVEPDVGEAVRVETVPGVMPDTEQVVPQLMEPPPEVTVPRLPVA